MVFTKEFWNQRREELRKKLSDSHKGLKRNYTHKHSEETKAKIREKRAQQKITEETKKKISASLKGNIPWIKGKHQTNEAKIKISNGLKGEKSYMWKGGYSPYPVNWTKTLKRGIRERDKYLCQICLNEGVEVHHIDYNKNNLNPNNLITLCKSCHAKTTHYKEWRDKLNDIMQMRELQ